jgi:hypothetical protein
LLEVTDAVSSGAVWQGWGAAAGAGSGAGGPDGAAGGGSGGGGAADGALQPGTGLLLARTMTVLAKQFPGLKVCCRVCGVCARERHPRRMCCCAEHHFVCLCFTGRRGVCADHVCASPPCFNTHTHAGVCCRRVQCGNGHGLLHCPGRQQQQQQQWRRRRCANAQPVPGADEGPGGGVARGRSPAARVACASCCRCRSRRRRGASSGRAGIS